MIQLTRNRIINLQSIISNILFLDETYLRDVMKVSENYFWMFVFPSNSRRVANISHRKAARRLAIICHWYLYRGEKETEEKYDREATYREGRSVTANSTEKKKEEKNTSKGTSLFHPLSLLRFFFIGTREASLSFSVVRICPRPVIDARP